MLRLYLSKEIIVRQRFLLNSIKHMTLSLRTKRVLKKLDLKHSNSKTLHHMKIQTQIIQIRTLKEIFLSLAEVRITISEKVMKAVTIIESHTQ
jgi:hypothetical protein